MFNEQLLAVLTVLCRMDNKLYDTEGASRFYIAQKGSIEVQAQVYVSEFTGLEKLYINMTTNKSREFCRRIDFDVFMKRAKNLRL